MAQRAGTMTLWLPICLGLIILFLLLRVRKKQQEGPVGVLEYWVMVEADTMPEDAVLIKRLVQARAIGSSDALLFTHISLHTALIQRAKNPHLFHPDSFEDETVSDRRLPLIAARAPAMVMLRFLASAPEKERNYLTFLPHLAHAIGEECKAVAIYDLGQKRLFTPEEFAKMIGVGKEAARYDAHVRVQWNDIPYSSARTIGLQKEGLPNLETGPMESDERMLVLHLLQEAATAVWNGSRLPDSVSVDYFGTQFRVQFEVKARSKDGKLAHVKLMRVERI
jgi:hypothetical protein